MRRATIASERFVIVVRGMRVRENDAVRDECERRKAGQHATRPNHIDDDR